MSVPPPPPVMDEQRANLFHELVLSNRIVENMMKGVNEIHGEKSAEQVLQNFLRKAKEPLEKLEMQEETEQAEATGLGEQNIEDEQNKLRNVAHELELLGVQLPRNLTKFKQMHLASFGSQSSSSSSSVPKNRQSNSMSSISPGEEVVEAVEQVANVTKTLAHVMSQTQPKP